MLSTRVPRLVVALYLTALAVCSVGLSRLASESDVFVFLPDDDPDVEFFEEVSERFGSLRTVLVGVEVDEGAVTDPQVIARIDRVTRALSELPSVSRVTSVTTVPVITTGPEGAAIAPLVGDLPQSDAEAEALRARVEAQDLVLGELVSRDLQAALIVVNVVEGTSTQEVVDGVRRTSDEVLGDLVHHFGGAPFAAEAIYGEARKDVQRLSPLAGVLLVLVVLLSFRDAVGVTLTLFAVAFGTLAVLGGMGLTGERYTLLSSTLPIVLLASGTAYPVHVLGRYYLERERAEPAEALERTGRIVLRPVAVAAWTTIGAFGAFGIMDVAPMRAFGWQVALGTLLCWLQALTLVPAVLTLIPRGPSREQLFPFGSFLEALWAFATRHPVAMGGGFLLLFAGASLGLPDVRARMDPQAFFREGSEPWRAHQFFETRFGGARMLQVAVDGDMGSPLVLRKLAAVADVASGVERTGPPSSLVEPTVLTMDVLGGGLALPRTPRQAAQVQMFLESDPSIAPYVSDDHQHALIYSRIRGDAEPVVAAMEDVVAQEAAVPLRVPTVRDVARRVAARLSGLGAPVSAAEVEPILAGALGGDDAKLRAHAVQLAAEGFVASEDAADLSEAQRATFRSAIDEGLEPAEAFARAVANHDDAEFYAEIFAQRVHEALVEARIDAILQALFERVPQARDDGRVVRALRVALVDLVRTDIEPGDGRFVGARVTGEPLLDRALARSVQRNQVRAMLLGMIIVAILLVGLFRSLFLSILCVAPAACAAALIGGVMGWMGVEIDLSTAMVGAIVTDTGSDFGMHYLWYLQRRSPDQVMRNVGPIVIVATVLVAAGFFAFTLGSSPVLRLFGTLSGATCVLSSLFAMVLVPAAFQLFPRWMARYHVDDDDAFL